MTSGTEQKVAPQAVFQQAVTFHEQGRLVEAEHLYRAILKTDPADVGSLHNLAIICIQQGRYDGAAQLISEVLYHQPDLAVAHYTLGVALRYLGRLAEAMVCCREALRLEPEYAEAHNTLGDILTTLGHYEEAERCCRAALRLNANYAEAYNNLGNVLSRRGKLVEAADAYRCASALKPDDTDALAVWFYLKQRMCDWSDYREHEAQILNGTIRRRLPDMALLLLGLASTAEQQFGYARQVAATLAVPTSARFPHPLSRSAEKLRLGYLCCGFREFPTAYLIAGVIEHHNRQAFEVIGYSAGLDDGGATRQRLAAAFDRFVDIANTPDLDAAQLIHSDAVDVLIDLNGYTPKPENRARILAYRPAPIQVNYLGYTGTMGADFIDYIIADRFVAPAEQQSFFSERLVHLPHSYLCTDDRREIAASPSRAECGLPENGFVFCCFNDSGKITPEFFDIWTRLLRGVPGSVLWLREGVPVGRTNLAREAAARGIAPERLIFATRVSQPEHLARHRLADLFLDTLPYNAHTTASDALWAGLPVLTCSGSTFAGRVAGSLLRAVGFDELVTTSLEEYEALALRLAQDTGRLRQLRARLAENRLTFPLFDTARSTRALEAAYQRMHEIRRAGQSPTAFSISPSGSCSPL